MQLATFAWTAYTCFAMAGGHDLFDPVPSNELPPMRTERATQADSAFTAESGHVQLEMETLALRTAWDSSVPTQAELFRILARVGVTDNVDVQILLPALTWAGFGTDATVLDASDAYTLRGKWNLWGNDGQGLALAVLPWVRIPVDASGVNAGLSVPFGGVLGEKLGLGGMLTVAGTHLGASPQLQTFASGYVSWDFGAGISAFGDVSVDVSVREFAALWKTSAGLVWLFHPNMQVDTGMITDVGASEPRLSWFTGFSIRG